MEEAENIFAQVVQIQVKGIKPVFCSDSDLKETQGTKRPYCQSIATIYNWLITVVYKPLSAPEVMAVKKKKRKQKE